MIEAHQLVSMTDLISQVLQQLSASYNNILNNNLNDNLTTLDHYFSFTSSFGSSDGLFGMNVPLPSQTSPMLGSTSAWLVRSYGWSCH